MALTIVPRAAWGARHERGAGPAPLPASEVWLHHTVTLAPDLLPPYDDEDAAMRTLERIGEERFGRGVSYTFAVMPTGRVYEGHGVDRVGAHTRGRNSRARGIALVGNYDRDNVPEPMRRAVAELLVHGKRAGWWREAKLNGGHRDVVPDTACPGRHAYALVGRINQRAEQLERTPPAAARIPDPTPAPQEDDVARLIKAKGESAVYGTDGVTRWHVPAPGVLAELRGTGVYGDGKVHELSPGTVNALPLVPKGQA